MDRERQRQHDEQERLAANEAKLQVINAGSDLEIAARQQLQDDLDGGQHARQHGPPAPELRHLDRFGRGRASPKRSRSCARTWPQQRGRLNLMAYQAETQGRREQLDDRLQSGRGHGPEAGLRRPDAVPADAWPSAWRWPDSLAMPPKEKRALAERPRNGLAFDAAAGMVDRNPAGFLARAGMTGTSPPGRRAAGPQQRPGPLQPAARGLPHPHRPRHGQREGPAGGRAREQDQVLADAQKAIGS
jgi:hypothetical protein